MYKSIMLITVSAIAGFFVGKKVTEKQQADKIAELEKTVKQLRQDNLDLLDYIGNDTKESDNKESECEEIINSHTKARQDTYTYTYEIPKIYKEDIDTIMGFDWDSPDYDPSPTGLISAECCYNLCPRKNECSYYIRLLTCHMTPIGRPEDCVYLTSAVNGKLRKIRPLDDDMDNELKRAEYINKQERILAEAPFDVRWSNPVLRASYIESMNVAMDENWDPHMPFHEFAKVYEEINGPQTYTDLDSDPDLDDFPYEDYPQAGTPVYREEITTLEQERELYMLPHCINSKLVNDPIFDMWCEQHNCSGNPLAIVEIDVQECDQYPQYFTSCSYEYYTNDDIFCDASGNELSLDLYAGRTFANKIRNNEYYGCVVLRNFRLGRDVYINVNDIDSYDDVHNSADDSNEEC